jgi:hypothetical protein
VNSNRNEVVTEVQLRSNVVGQRSYMVLTALHTAEKIRYVCMHSKVAYMPCRNCLNGTTK